MNCFEMTDSYHSPEPVLCLHMMKCPIEEEPNFLIYFIWEYPWSNWPTDWQTDKIGNCDYLSDDTYWLTS
jgi:hypothetical protein